MVSFIVSEGDRETIGAGPLDLIASAVSDHFKLPDVQVELSLAGPDDIRELNKEYRGLDEPTDVLSFQLLGGLDEIQALPTDASVLLGSIVICPHKVELYGETLPQMVEHGLLHVLGFDHVTDLDGWLAAERPLLARIPELHIPEVPADEHV